MPGMNKTLGIGLGLIGGILAGAAIGLLYAPKRGAETRKMVQEKATEYGSQAKETISRASSTVSERIKPLMGEAGVSRPTSDAGMMESRNLPVTRPAEIETEEAAHPRQRAGRRGKVQVPQETTVNTRMTSEVAPNKNISGDTLTDPAGKEIGKLEGVMLDAESGEIIYGVVAFNNAASPDELCAVPWPAIKQAGGNSWTLQIPQPEKGQAMFFARNRVPDQTTAGNIDATYDRYGYTRATSKKREGRRIPVQNLDK